MCHHFSNHCAKFQVNQAKKRKKTIFVEIFSLPRDEVGNSNIILIISHQALSQIEYYSYSRPTLSIACVHKNMEVGK